MKRRDRMINVRVNQAEKEAVKKPAEVHRLPVSTYVRKTLLDEAELQGLMRPQRDKQEATLQ